jgi:hypothetical protein
MTGESVHLASAAGLPPMATPMTVKMPEPMTAPMPKAVSETGPSVLRRARSGRSESAISLSIDLVAKICLGSVELLQTKSTVNGHQRKRIRGTLALGLAARSLLDLSLVLAARAGALAFGRGGLACRALDLLALNLVCDAFCICHEG